QVTWIPTQQFINSANANTQAFFKAYGNLRSDLTTLATVTKADLAARGQACASTGAPTCAALASNTPMFSKVTYRVPTDAGGGSPQNTYDLLAKVDYNLSEKTQMYVRYARY